MAEATPAGSDDEVRVLIIADDPLLRGSLAAVLALRPGLTVAGQTAATEDFRTALETFQPDVVLWDVGWDHAPGGSEALAAKLERLAGLEGLGRPVLLMLADADQALDSWSAGPHALLLRDLRAEQLDAAIKAAAQGLVVLTPELLPALIPRSPAPVDLPVEQLTPRERQVLQLLAEGLPNKAIAGRLGVSEHTVKFHVNAILGKLDVQSRTEAVVRASRLGLILL